jgi:hypothetical protein
MEDTQKREIPIQVARATQGCLGVWLWLFFKVLFTQKSVPIIFFYFLKIIFEISTSK